MPISQSVSDIDTVNARLYLQGDPDGSPDTTNDPPPASTGLEFLAIADFTCRVPFPSGTDGNSVQTVLWSGRIARGTPVSVTITRPQIAADDDPYRNCRGESIQPFRVEAKERPGIVLLAEQNGDVFVWMANKKGRYEFQRIGGTPIRADHRPRDFRILSRCLVTRAAGQLDRIALDSLVECLTLEGLGWRPLPPTRL